MLPLRILICEAIVELLQQSLDKRVNIKTAITIPVSFQDLPLITISLDKANILFDWLALDGKGQVLEMIEQILIIKIYYSAIRELNIELELLAARISEILIQNETLNGLVKTTRLDEQDLSISNEGEKPIGIMTQHWAIIYRKRRQNAYSTVN
jgi:hypothetical protein